MLTGTYEIIAFSGFLLFIMLMLSLDLGIFNRKSHALSFREALLWTFFWVGLAIGFYLLLRFFGNELHGIKTNADIQSLVIRYHHPLRTINPDHSIAIADYNRNLSLEFITGYLIEYSLSVDNIFVIIMIFLSFNIEQRYYHRVLFWGILGAILMRFLFIFVASALISRFEWILIIFGVILVILGFKMGWEFFSGKVAELIDTEHHPVVKFLSKYFSVTRDKTGHHFWVRREGKILITPLLIVLIIIEFSDVLFAVDSVPAVFSVTRDPLIVFFSNIFAILGLRSLFFLVMNVMNRFRFLKLGLACLLSFIGVKMVFQISISTNHSLGIIIGILSVFIILSMIFPGKKEKTIS
ncbi:MAG: TerC/Alx family metal homeostasis membrane protein [Bacteroidetes bacterium]|nr:TerC/Alx family metal homeostasis membrane protein [Bacteroidota bacterium]